MSSETAQLPSGSAACCWHLIDTNDAILGNMTARWKRLLLRRVYVYVLFVLTIAVTAFELGYGIEVLGGASNQIWPVV